MISHEELTGQISGTIGKTKVLELSHISREQQFALRDLIDISFHANKDIAFRAAWILENVFLENPAVYEPDLEYLLSRIKEVKHESCQRHYAKILMHITDRKAPAVIKEKVAQYNMEPIVEQSFDWMIDPRVKIAVKCFSAEVLFNLRMRYPWVNEELENQVKFLMKNGSAGIQSRGRKILAELVRGVN